MATIGFLIPDEELNCSICLEVLTQPVSTPCGHNFCNDCIQHYWQESNICWCPYCKEEFTLRPELHVNTVLNNIVEQFKAFVQSQGLNSGPPEEGAIPCTICPNNKAVKSCLTCLASFCQWHLEPHQRVAGLRFHALRDPLSLEERLCKTHDRVREMYCRTDGEFVCIECFPANHEGHKVVPLMVEFQLVAAKSEAAKVGLQKMIDTRSKTKAEFEELVKLVVRLRESSLENLTSLADLIEKLKFDNEIKCFTVTREARESLKVLEKEINDLKKRKQLLEMLPNCRDHHGAIRNFPTLNDPQVTNWSNVHILANAAFLDQIKDLSQLHKRFRELPGIREVFTQCEGEDVPSVHSVLMRGEVKKPAEPKSES